MIDYSEAHTLLTQFARWATDNADQIEDTNPSAMVTDFLQQRATQPPIYPVVDWNRLPVDPNLVGATVEEMKADPERTKLSSPLSLTPSGSLEWGIAIKVLREGLPTQLLLNNWTLDFRDGVIKLLEAP